MTSIMPDLYALLSSKNTVNANTLYYWGYQYRLARQTLAPRLLADGGFQPGFAVAEIGCAEGGVLAAFAQAGAGRALGTDIAQERLRSGAEILQALDPTLAERIELSAHDVLFDAPRQEWRNAFDLVILRDVLEHLDDTALALANIRRLLKPNGFFFVEFPPYYSPFGGHQHLLKNFWGKIPYMHLAPKGLFTAITASGWKDLDIEEVRRLRGIALTPRKFLRAARGAGYSVVRERYYLLRPVFKIKFGLPAISLSPLQWLPGVKNFFSMEANYLLRLEANDTSASSSKLDQ